MRPWTPVIVGVDDAWPGLAALAVAASLAMAHGSRLIAVRARALGLSRHADAGYATSRILISC